MIKVFGITDKSYTTNGDIVLQTTKAKVHKQDNGDFYITIEAPLSYIDYLVPNNIIVANTPQGDQAFRITNVENTRTKIKIKAYHVFYDTKNYLIQDSYVVDKNCNDALDHLNNSTDNTSPFTTISDVTKIASYRCVRKSLYEAIQVLIERYGGHLVRDNWTIGIRSSIGQDNGVTIRYGKNLKDIKATYSWDNVCTKLMPVGKDGLLLNALDPTNDVYLESQVQYDIPYTKTVTFDQNNIVEDDYKDEDGQVDTEAYTEALLNDLAEQGENYLATNSIPVVNYTLSANVEKVSDIGDTIQVIDEKLGIDLETNIISYDYDCVLEKYTQIEFGNFVPTLSGLMNNITNQAQQIVDESIATIEVTLGDELREAQDKIWNALGSSYVIYEGDKILVVDKLPKETATNVIMINNGGIGFSNSGINGTFNSAWTIDNVLNMEQINVINLTADLIKGGTLKLGSNLNQNGQIEVYDEANTLIAELNKNGLKMYGVDGSYILMNNSVGFAGYDRLGNQIYWVSKDEFHMKKSVVEEEITLCNKMRFIPIEIYNGNTLVNDGIGLVSVAGGGN
jgi:phage minor structural protein